MDIKIIVVASVASGLICALLAYVISKVLFNKKLKTYRNIEEAVTQKTNDLDSLLEDQKKAESTLSNLRSQHKEVLEVKAREEVLKESVSSSLTKLEELTNEFENTKKSLVNKKKEQNELIKKLDIYSDIDEYISVGFFEQPEYLYETSDRFAEEIKEIRNQQKEMIKAKTAITCPEDITISPLTSHSNKILNGQIKLMLSAFNIECDLLLGKLKPSNFSRILEQIEKNANSIEKNTATLECGFNIKYIKLKYEECRLQYQYLLKKQEEIAEQKLIREQMREEARIQKEYEKAISDAEKEEKMYEKLLEKAQNELKLVSDEERQLAQLKIEQLEEQLKEAQEKYTRAQSMAELTKRGHVYIISNLGSFGDNVYKIGLTRRLDPIDRIKELSGASVPFAFDVHAMIYAEDAPALEAALHREFTQKRVNAVNLRKEFFRVSLNEIKEAAEKLQDNKFDFKMTALAEDYNESLRLRSIEEQTFPESISA